MSVPALFSHDKTPAITSFKSELMAGEFIISPDRNLVPADVLELIVKEADENLKPAEESVVLKWAELLVGSYPSNQIKEPKIYIRSLLFDMKDFPEEIIEIAVHELRREKKWIPTCAEVYQKCNFMLCQMSAVKQRALNQLKEHERRNKK